MILSRNEKILLFCLLPLFALLVAANHLEGHARALRLNASDIVVRTEGGGLSAHSTIGLDEKASVKNPPPSLLKFSTLGQWDFSSRTPPPCPEAISAFNGRDIICVGFMYPLEAGQSIKTFCLLRSTQTCCYGPRPQWNRYIFVEAQEAVKFERLTPVLIRGKFFVDPQPKQGFIYRMEASKIVAIQDDFAEEDPAEVARSLGLQIFDFDLLSETKASRIIAPELLALNGKRVVVPGFLLGRSEAEIPELMLGRDPLETFAKGKPPGVYDAVLIRPDSKQEVPPLWRDSAFFTGVLKIERDPARFSENGIVSLLHAKRGAGEGQSWNAFTSKLRPDGGPLIPLAAEAIGAIALAGAFLCLRWRKTTALATAFIICVSIEADDAILTTVNGEPIYASEVEIALTPDSFGFTRERERKTKLDRLIQNRIIAQYLKAQRIVVSDADVDAEVEHLRKEPPLLEGCPCCRHPSLEAFMEANGLAMNELRDSIRNNTGFERLFGSQWETAYPNDEARKKLLESEAPAIREACVKVSHIFFNVLQAMSDGAGKGKVREKLRAEAQVAWARLEKGENFEKLAAELSHDFASKDRGGLLGVVPRGVFGKRFAEESENLPFGAYSKPVESPWGFHIIVKAPITDDDLLKLLKEEFIALKTEEAKASAFEKALIVQSPAKEIH